MVEKSMGIPDDVRSHHDDGCDGDIGQDDADHSGEGFDNFEMLDKASRDLLYEECKGCDKEHMMLWMTHELLKLKASSECSDISFSALSELLTKVLPKGLPSSTYQAKKIIFLLTLGIEKSMLA
jgi:hypothetical protein